MALPPLRRVTVRAADRTDKVRDILLLTNRFDLSACEVALLYQHRWQVELFFRWLKCMAHFEHFFSESLEGMTLQVCVTIIGTLLIALHVGARPTKYDYALMSSALRGWTSIEHVRAMAIKRRDAARRRAERAGKKRAFDCWARMGATSGRGLACADFVGVTPLLACSWLSVSQAPDQPRQISPRAIPVPDTIGY